MTPKTVRQHDRRWKANPERLPRIRRNRPGGVPVDLRGFVVESLTVLKLLPRKPGVTHRYWLCRCSCGRNHKARSNHLIAGSIRHCRACSER